MNEEWYNDQVRISSDNDWVGDPYEFSLAVPAILNVCQRPNYDVWLNQVVAEYQLRLDRKDRMFARFLLDLPSVPSDVFTLLRDLCTEPDRYVRLSLTDLIDK
jgi:symplekin